MSEEAIAPEVRAFIAAHIESVVQLEILLLLHGAAGASHSAADLSTQLRIDPAWAEAQLADLCTRGLLRCAEGPPATYQFAAKDPSVAEAVDALAKAYADRRVSVISLIFSKPIDKIRSFADAFRIRRNSTHG